VGLACVVAGLLAGAVIASEAKPSTPPLPDRRAFDLGGAGWLRCARHDSQRSYQLNIPNNINVLAYIRPTA
jgi:hypothetical protein